MEQLKNPPGNFTDSNFLDSDFRYILFPIAYSIFFLVGFITNIYVLFVLRCLREARAMAEIRIYMTNLTIADLLFVCALPFWVSYYSRKGNWVFMDFMCRLTGTLFFINNYGTILFLGAISLNRYWAVTRPLNAASSDHRRRGIIVSTAIWLFTVSMSIPYLASPGTNSDSGKTLCFEGYQNTTLDEKKTIAITHFLIIALFFVVFFLVVVCNFLIARALLSQQSKFRSDTIISKRSNTMTLSSSKRPKGVKRRALQMLLAVVGVFVLCFLPHHIVQGPWVLAVLEMSEGWGQVNWSQNTRQILNDSHQITLVLMGLNCVLDPVVYFFATRKFRSFIVDHFKKFSRGEACSYTANTQVSMDSKNHSQRIQQPNEE